MPRRFNYTDRKLIEQQDIDIQLVFAGDHVSFEPKVNFAKHSFPASAHAFIEVFRKAQLVRFDFGPVSSPGLCDGGSLDEFGGAAGAMGLQFQIKVVDTASKNILALSKPVHAGNDPGGGADSILPLGRLPQDDPRIWTVDFTDGPTLYINHALEVQVTQKEYFIALVYPAVLQQVLEYAFLYHREEEFEWRDKWKQYVCDIRHAPPFPTVEPSAPQEEQEEQIRAWIEQAVRASITDKKLAEKANEWD